MKCKFKGGLPVSVRNGKKIPDFFSKNKLVSIDAKSLFSVVNEKYFLRLDFPRLDVSASYEKS